MIRGWALQDMTKSRRRPLVASMLREIRGGTFWADLKSISTGSYNISIEGKELQVSKAELSN
jgi:hypothetical protein